MYILVYPIVLNYGRQTLHNYISITISQQILISYCFVRYYEKLSNEHTNHNGKKHFYATRRSNCFVANIKRDCPLGRETNDISLPVSPLSSLPASDPAPLEETTDSREGDLDAGVGSRHGAMRHGGGDGDGAPTPGLCRSPRPWR